jgi:CubicO group peptidase (beta-lactamase class C family)
MGAVRPTGRRAAGRRASLVVIEASISGDCLSDFAAVREAFRANFEERGEVGAAVCVIRRGEIAVDLWGGWANEAQTLPWQRATAVNFYSVGKAIVASLLLAVVDRGLLTLDTRVSDIWPEFAAGGKSEVTVRQALCHEAAVPAIRESLTNDDLFDWPTMTAALAATDPWWEIGTRHAYHTNTFGHLIGELVRRTTGELPGSALLRITDEIDADIWFGVPGDRQADCAEVIWAPSRPARAIDTIDTSTLTGDALMNVLAHFNPPGASSVGIVNTPEWRSAQIPSTNGHGTARGLARYYAALLEPDHILSAPLLAEATRPQAAGPCSILGDDVAFGLGFTPTTERRRLGPNPRSFGHFGTGGALGFADPDAGIAFGYVMNHVIPRWQSSRNRALIDALYDALKAAA